MDKYQLKTRPIVIRRESLDHYSDLDLDGQDLVILLKLIYVPETSDKQPSIELLQKGPAMQPRDITMVIRNLVQRELLGLQVQKGEGGRFTEYMNLDPFFEKLGHILKRQSMETKERNSKEEFRQLLGVLEDTFARSLSPYEIETLNQWVDVGKRDTAIIQATLDEANSLNKFSFKYVDRILLNWKENNVRTIDGSRKIREKFNRPKMAHTVKMVPKFDWLNGENLDGKQEKSIRND